MHTRTLATLAVACAGFAAGPALAADTTLSACIGKQTGVMRFTDAGTGCRSGESLVTWNVQGPQGPQGAPGPQGPAGSQTLLSAVVLGDGTIQVVNKPQGATFTVARTAPGVYQVAVTGLGNTCPLPTALAFAPVAMYLNGGSCSAGALNLPVLSASGQDVAFAITVTALQVPAAASLRSQAITILGER